MYRAICACITFVAVPVAQAGLHFNFTSSSPVSTEVNQAFVEAGQRWSSLFSNDIDVNVTIGFRSLSPGVVGQTSFRYDLATYADVASALKNPARPLPGQQSAQSLPSGDISMLLNRTAQNPDGAFSSKPYLDKNGSANNTTLYYTTANGKALGLLSPHGTRNDATIEFNSDFKFDFNPKDGVDADKRDFVGAAAHELGHALGFVSGVDDLDEADRPDEDVEGLMTPLDLFRFSHRSTQVQPGLRDWSDDSEAKYLSVDGGKTVLGNFATGSRFGDGDQASHWKEAVVGGVPVGIMNPSLMSGTAEVITNADLLAFTAIGYNPVPETFTWVGGGLMGVLMLFRASRRSA